ncbi:acyl-CoA dehydrogenase [Paenibacillus sp.]|uniref:acyl-CoA dehydrogenase n=1 Tax=Paenibacillus sp. TaxID=58172 RepID=UPI002D5FCEFF|nr:acyl-CoA dehydrogenase [Paenibacillus sp.]HZG57031.1 acyl-CoA dehydrogenase [Paenibacillus sp.]
MFTMEQVEALRAAAGRWERDGALGADALERIYEQNLFKLFVPRRFGGRMASLPEALRAFEAAAFVDGSFGWAVTIGSGGGYFASCLPPDVAREMYAAREAVVAGSGAPSGRAVREPGGYRLTGAWSYCSGASFATAFTATATVDGDEPETLAFALRPDQVRVIADWRATGLRATASHTIEVQGAFVPASNAFRVDRTVYDDAPIYRVPFLPFAESSFAAVAIGIGKHLLEEARAMTEAAREAAPAGGEDRRPEIAARRIEEGAKRLEAQSARYYDAVERAWRLHLEGSAEAADWANVGAQSKRSAGEAIAAAQRVLPHLGLRAVMEDAPVNRMWRDLQTACQHKLLIDPER